MTQGIIIVDHGSRSQASNDLLMEVVRRFSARYRRKFPIVEPAHMELAHPSLEEAYARCVSRGAEHVVICPFFLGPGKHLQEDIPQLAADAAAPFVDVSYQVAPPLGVDDLMLQLLDKRIGELPTAVQVERRYDPTH